MLSWYSRILLLAFLMSIVIVLGVQPLIAQEDLEPSRLPLLEPGLHLGTTFYGNGNVPEDDGLTEAVTVAADSGMGAFNFSVDWAELEPQPGQYELAELKASLMWLNGLGIQPLLNISFIDVTELTLPDDLLNEDGDGLIDGMTFDDPVMLDRLNSLLDEVVPLLVEHGGFLLLLGNEVDAFFYEVPSVDPEAYVRLIDAARSHVHVTQPELAVGVTLTGTEVLAEGDIFQLLRPATDIIPFNFYPIDWWSADWYTVFDLEDISGYIDQFMQIYGNAPVVIQELGCPSAEANGSSLDYQAQCFEVMFEALQAYPNVRYVTVFTLFDWDEAACDLVIDWFGLTEDELPDIYFDRWRGFLCTLGLLNPDFSPKPAWEVFLNTVESQ